MLRKVTLTLFGCVHHELGHAFANLTDVQLSSYHESAADYLLKLTQLFDKGFPDRPDNVSRDRDSGFIGGFGNFGGWQQSRQGSVSEEFADMFGGWVYGAWASNDDGAARQDFMNSNMPMLVNNANLH